MTVPFKLDAFALASAHSARAGAAGAVNTLARRGEGWFGDNTDGAGVVRDLTVNLGVEIAGRDVLVLGAGGATRGILDPLLAQRPRVAGRQQPDAGKGGRARPPLRRRRPGQPPRRRTRWPDGASTW